MWQRSLYQLGSEDITIDGSTSSGAYPAWNAAIAGRYFHDGCAGKPVYLALDDEEAEEIARDLGGGTGGAEQLAAAVRGTLRPQGDRFTPHLVERTKWRKAGLKGPPPYLALLGLCVLAASRMARDDERGIAPHAYYPQLNPLLGAPPVARMPSGFEQVDDLWRDLCRWLDDDEGGRLGASTAVTRDVFPHIWWPISQCLLRARDRRRLTEFFRAVGLEPDTDIEAAQLWMLLRNWAREGCGLSSQAVNVIKGASEEIGAQIGELVKREFDAWEGEILDAQGRRRGEIALVVEIGAGGRRIEAGLVPHRPPGFPEAAEWTTDDGRDLSLRATSDEWYDRLALSVDRGVLRDGLTLATAGFSLSYGADEAVPLRATLGVGGWASVRQATVAEEHAVLVAAHVLPVARQFLQKFAEPGWRVLERTGNLPRGWQLIQRVRIMRAVAEAPVALHRLAPRLFAATKLDGGLQVAPRQYLTGAEPDLWVTLEEAGTIELDGTHIPAARGAIELKLSKSAPPLEPGDHEVSAGGVRRRFTTFTGFPAVATVGTGSLGHVFERHRHYRPSSVDAEPLKVDGPPRGTVYVTGAAARAHADDLPEPPQPPILVPTGFRGYVVLGARRSELLSLIPPNRPAWLADVGLQSRWQFFDQPVPFEAQWLILHGLERAQVRAVRTPPSPPASDPDGALLDGLGEAWAMAIRDAAASAVPPARHADEWAEYLEAARL